MFTKNGNILKVNGNWLNPHVEPGPVIYDYMTFKAASTGSGNFDQAYGCSKKYDSSYMKNLDTGTETSLRYSSIFPTMYWNLTAGTTYMCYWSDEDIESTKNSYISYWNSYPVAMYNNSDCNKFIGELYSMDFWHKPNWSEWRMINCTIIPQDYRNIHRGEELTDCSHLFINAPITNSIEKFIKAMQIACPNLTRTTGCFYGCTTAPDYSYCLTTYPGWF